MVRKKKTIDDYCKIKILKLIEPRIWWIFRVGWRIPKEKFDFNDKSLELYKRMCYGDMKGLVEKWEIKKFTTWMATAHRDASSAYMTMGGIREIGVIDLDSIEKFLEDRKKASKNIKLKK